MEFAFLSGTEKETFSENIYSCGALKKLQAQHCCEGDDDDNKGVAYAAHVFCNDLFACVHVYLVVCL